MDTVHLVRRFDTMGARLVVRRRDRLARPFRLDVGRDRDGEYFELVVSPRAPACDVLNVDPAGRHLLLYAAAERFLCGHDERHWFVAKARAAAVPPGAQRLSTWAAYRRGSICAMPERSPQRG